MTEPGAGQSRRRADNVAVGIGLTVLAIVIFGVQDAVSKSLVQTHSPFQLAMVRFWAFAAFSLWLVSRQGPLKQAFRSRHPWLQILRGVLLVVDIWTFAIALRTVPLAELLAVVLVYPLLATLAAIPILGERVGVFRLVAVAIGFCGALVIVRPGGLPIDGGVLFAIVSASTYALYMVLTRKVSASDSTATSMVYAGVVGLVMTTGVGLFFWQPFEGVALWQMLFMMISSTAAHGLMVAALSRAPASTLQPFNYLALPWGIFLSYQFFGHLIDPVALIGGAVIVGAGLVVMARERHLARSGRRVAPSEAEEETLPH